MENGMTILATEIVGKQLERLRTALESADLPADDIELPGRTFFEFTLNGTTVGWGGFETYEADGLLRSIIVDPAHRSKGVGVSLLQLIELKAAELGVTRLHLLTTNASGFFEQQGYEVRQRGSEPPMISQTEQFRDLCPGSAVYLCKRICKAVSDR
jgi:N-acetylglutamate synthase-like GNAT family acetyltransferase